MKQAARRGKRAAQGVYRRESAGFEGARPRMIVGSGGQAPPQPPQARAADGGIRTGHRGHGPPCTEAPDVRFRGWNQVTTPLTQALCQNQKPFEATQRKPYMGSRFRPTAFHVRAMAFACTFVRTATPAVRITIPRYVVVVRITCHNNRVNRGHQNA